jgi:hypothetical protein
MLMRKVLFTVFWGMIAVLSYSQFSVGAKAGMVVSTFSGVNYNQGLTSVFRQYNPLDEKPANAKNHIVWIALGYRFNL